MFILRFESSHSKESFKFVSSGNVSKISTITLVNCLKLKKLFSMNVSTNPLIYLGVWETARFKNAKNFYWFASEVEDNLTLLHIPLNSLKVKSSLKDDYPLGFI